MKRFRVQKRKRFFINENIHFPIVKLIDENGNFCGDLARQEALSRAESTGFDLVLIDANQRPPIAKIVDFGKFLYEQNRKERKQRAKAKETEIKEIRLSFNLSEHDRQVKQAKAKKFIDDGHRVKLQIRLRGRENIFSQKAIDLLTQFAEGLNSDFEQNPQRIGRSFSVFLRPRKDVNSHKLQNENKDS